MKAEVTYKEIQKLHDLNYLLSKKDSKATAELNRIHFLVFGSNVDISCGNCRIKAFHKLTSLTLEQLKEMENQKFKIKKGQLLEYPFGSGQVFSANSGISNENAEKILAKYPKLIESFEVYPGSESESKEYKPLAKKKEEPKKGVKDEPKKD